MGGGNREENGETRDADENRPIGVHGQRVQTKTTRAGRVDDRFERGVGMDGVSAAVGTRHRIQCRQCDEQGQQHNRGGSRHGDEEYTRDAPIHRRLPTVH